MLKRDAFKAYDIRGRVPDELNEEMAYRVGRAYVQLFQMKKVVVGHDIRLSSPAIAQALIRGLNDAGCDVADIGQCGTEQVYFATAHWKLDGGIMVTASHNPKDYNGMKLVRAGARPISRDSGLKELEELVIGGNFAPLAARKGTVSRRDVTTDYVDHILTYVDPSVFCQLKIVANSGNGSAGPVIHEIAKRLPCEFIHVFDTPDGTFPNGVPNPLLPENQEATAKVVRETGADLGVAWDGDFDRCFLFDGQGNYIEAYYIIGFLVAAFLKKYPGAKIIHDPRLMWNTVELIKDNGGIPVLTKTGHAFMKERLRKEDAVYGGEMSAHHYFKDFSYCDSGMIPWLMVVESMCREGKSLADMVKARMEKYPVSGEINRQVKDPQQVIRKVEEKYAVPGTVIDWTDGLSVDYPQWRFNLRMSNTEPLIRLNVETRGDEKLMREKTAELLAFIDATGK